jgi:superfamily II DNA or RNA helicase
VFVAQAEASERSALERAGFAMHEPTLCEDKARCKACRGKIGRYYWSSRVEDATRLRSHCNDLALRAMKNHLDRLEKSRAVTADIEVPHPPGMDYLPYQKAGISYALQRKDTLIGDQPGLGKDQPLDAKLLTPTGWTLMGHIKLGDLIIGSDGLPHPVTGIFPQGKKKVFRVTFQDGSSTECGDEHLWEVNTSLRRWGGYAPRIKTLREIRSRLTDKDGKRRHFIKLAKPIDFRTSFNPFICPYVMGYLLGNRGFSQVSVRVTIPDPESVKRINHLLPPGFILSQQTPIDYIITYKDKKKRRKSNAVLDEMRRLGLMGHRTEKKFIPPEYFWIDAQSRLDLLQGLLDADAHSRPLDGNVEYSSSSPRLARDTQQLIWSLGGTAKIRPKPTKRLPSYRMSVRMPPGIPLFRLRRKLICQGKWTKYPPYRVIASVKEIGIKETQCIRVDSPDGLYVTDDFILTHNTVEALGFINYLKARHVLVVAPATLSFNWKLEAEKWLVEPYEIFIPEAGMDAIPEIGDRRLLVICNYEKLATRARDGTEQETEFAKSLRRVWDVSVFDEAHALKNPGSKRSQAVLGEFGLMRRSHRTLFLTGTPMENFPKEIWPIAASICPAKFGDWWDFARRYCGLHSEMHGTHKAWVSTGSSHLSELQQRLRSTFMVRRLKQDVLKELPPKRRQLVVLGDSQIDWSQHPEFRKWKEIYERRYEEALAKLEAAKTTAEYRAAMKALDAFIGIAFQEMSEFRHKTALAKLPMCVSYLDQMLAATNDSIVIFAHHKDVLQKLAEHFASDCVVLFGDTPMDERGKVVKDFQEGRKRIFIGGLKAAGAGLTLTKASTVVFIEIDWNPATLSQAEDRLCRIGQKKMVHVLHLVLNNTLDVNMGQRVIQKQGTIDRALDHLPEQLRLKQVG